MTNIVIKDYFSAYLSVLVKFGGPFTNMNSNPDMDNNYTIITCEIKLLIHFRTSNVQRLKFGNQ